MHEDKSHTQRLEKLIELNISYVTMACEQINKHSQTLAANENKSNAYLIASVAEVMIESLEHIINCANKIYDEDL